METAAKYLKDILKMHIACDDYKLFYICTSEELKALNIIKEIAREKETFIYIFDIADGLRSENDKRLRALSQESLINLSFVLKWLEKNAKGYAIFLNINKLLETDPKLSRSFKNLIHSIIENALFIKLFIISPYARIPDELQLDAFYLDLPLPTRNEIVEIIDGVCSHISYKVNPTLREQFINALQGMREIDIINALKFSLFDGELIEEDLGSIMQLKHQLIKKESLLEFLMPSEGLDNVGGMKTLKDWLKRKGTILKNLNEAINFGVDIPKGILLFGMPGCGKSLVAKVIGSEWKLPLLRLDMGMILGPYVGQSEENIRKAIKIAESVAPCVLWIDELEKGFAGISGESSSEVMKRVFGSFLTWMQEKTKPVFVVATANDIINMPPEFLRKGRFDELFYVDFPDDEARKEIIRIHLKKRKKEEWIKDIVEFSNNMNGFSGADIESVIVELIEKVFIAKIKEEEYDIKEIIKKILADFKPMTKTMENKIKEMQNKLKEINAKNAN